MVVVFTLGVREECWLSEGNPLSRVGVFQRRQPTSKWWWIKQPYSQQVVRGAAQTFAGASLLSPNPHGWRLLELNS